MHFYYSYETFYPNHEIHGSWVRDSDRLNACYYFHDAFYVNCETHHLWVRGSGPKGWANMAI